MSIILLIIILICLIPLWVVIMHAFDIALIKGVINSVKGNIQLNKEELTEAVKRFLENRNLNIAHKLYLGAVSGIAGGNAIFSFARGVLKIEQGENKYTLDLLYDNGLPVWVDVIFISEDSLDLKL